MLFYTALASFLSFNAGYELAACLTVIDINNIAPPTTRPMAHED